MTARTNTPVFPEKRGPGRPPKKPPAIESAEKMYERVKPILPADVREYLEKSMQGDVDFDGMLQMDLLLRQLSIYISSVVSWATDDGIISRDVAALIAEYRMGIKDHEEMRRKRIELDHKYGNNGGMVDTTSKPALDRFKDISERDS